MRHPQLAQRLRACHPPLTARVETIIVIGAKKKTAVGFGDPAVSFACFPGKNSWYLFFVAVEAVYRRDGAEQAVLFAVNAGGEEQSVGRSSGPVVAEGERPEPING